jgi:predicted nucleotidyltransferase component of viral defense system
LSEYSRKELGKQAAELGFIRDTFEKISRLADLLSFFERDPVLSRYLALKGGTAINLTIFNLPRLSVDIDFDFAENLPLNEAMAMREAIRDTVRRHMVMRGYILSEKTKEYHALDSSVYQYTSAGGFKDNIKIEINYSLRSHVLPLMRRTIETLGVFTQATVLTLDPVEIFAAKIAALLSRAAARDLYDVNNMIHFKLFDETQTDTLRKCAVFYTAIASERVPDTFDFTKMDALTEREIKMRLAPMLRKKELFNLDVARERVKKYLTSLFELSDNEKQFLSAFHSGKYNPDLLFDGDLLERVRDHPMAAWKMQLHGQSKPATI